MPTTLPEVSHVAPQIALAQVMTYAETAKLANISRATLQRLVTKKLSPPVVALSARRRGFRTGDVLAWLEARASSNGERS